MDPKEMTVQELYSVLEDENEATLCAVLQAVAGRHRLAVRSLAGVLERSAATGSTSAEDYMMRSRLTRDLPRLW